mmetsp:Transcript_2096/g.6406  ORF Transcript_2096/g.6406 Transcript_2096/m.6406 type:complete len:333 (+) Transcript_2096:1382-2380(+)
MRERSERSSAADEICARSVSPTCACCSRKTASAGTSLSPSVTSRSTRASSVVGSACAARWRSTASTFAASWLCPRPSLRSAHASSESVCSPSRSAEKRARSSEPRSPSMAAGSAGGSRLAAARATRAVGAPCSRRAASCARSRRVAEAGGGSRKVAERVSGASASRKKASMAPSARCATASASSPPPPVGGIAKARSKSPSCAALNEPIRGSSAVASLRAVGPLARRPSAAMACVEMWSCAGEHAAREVSSRIRPTRPESSADSSGASVASAQSKATSPFASSSVPPASWPPSCITSRPTAWVAPICRASAPSGRAVAASTCSATEPAPHSY